MAVEMQLFVLHYTFNYSLIVNLEQWFSADGYFLPTGYILGTAGDTVQSHRSQVGDTVQGPTVEWADVGI